MEEFPIIMLIVTNIGLVRLMIKSTLIRLTLGLINNQDLHSFYIFNLPTFQLKLVSHLSAETK